MRNLVLDGFPPGEEVALGKIVGVGRNYAAHAREMGALPPGGPILFLKPATSYVASGGVVRLPSVSKRVDHEVELAVVIGKTTRGLVEAKWRDAVLGYGVLLDLTARDLQEQAKSRGEPWTVSKAFDTFTPLSRIVPRGRVSDPQALELELRVNGELRQRGNTRDMIFPVSALLAYASRIMTLERGDVIATGTPEGVGPLRAGDRAEARIPGLVDLKVTVESA